ncbi:MAG TPA: hypothetical protein VN674_00615 [Gemmatimonadales bacterium]|nr:hypothetical protein [Gemmatimonadales bacterium]
MASKSIHAILPVAAIVLGLPTIAGGVWYVMSVTAPYEAPAGKTVFDVAQGVWKWTTSDSSCLQVRHTISFTPDRKVMIITHNKSYPTDHGTRDSVSYYDILRYDRSSIEGAIRGETRRTSKGALVVWDLVLKGPDTYAWHRTDWLPRSTTASVRRCTAAELKLR